MTFHLYKTVILEPQKKPGQKYIQLIINGVNKFTKISFGNMNRLPKTIIFQSNGFAASPIEISIPSGNYVQEIEVWCSPTIAMRVYSIENLKHPITINMEFELR